MLVGAGTVLTTGQVEQAVDAGAEFIVSPGFDPEIVDLCLEKKIPVFPGCMTPSEVAQGVKRGLKVIKFFPAKQAGGLDMIRALSAAALHPLAEGAVQIMIAGPDEISKWTEEYRPRFDLLGAVAALKLDGVPVLVHAGLCDEFGMRRTPPGFDEAGIGGFFLKPGVGVLKKDRGGRYDFFHPYPVETLLKTESRSGPGELTFLQCVDDFHGFGYRYTKQYRFEADSSRLVIRYELINTGKKPIVTDQYNHNFFSFGKNLPGTQYRIRTDFAAKPLQRSGAWCSYRRREFAGFRMIPPRPLSRSR